MALVRRVVCCTLAVFSLVVLLLPPGCSREPVRLHILEAGSLVIPFEEVEKEFERQNPGIDLLLEGHGSIQVVRHITEIHDEADIAAVADYSLLPMLMYPVQLPDDQGPYADWTISFATNCLGLAYTPQSAYSDEIDAGNWHEILSREDVTFGISDPRFDACGYRSLMLLRLAEDHYDDTDILERLIVRSFRPAIKVREEEGVCTIQVPELLEPIERRVTLRGFSVQLLALLESRDLDYAFQYESVARQHGLEFLQLPPEVDLSSAEHAHEYQRVRVKIDFRRFATVTPEFEGLPIVYGVTIPRNAPHKKEAVEFLRFLLGPGGRRILEDARQPVMPPAVDNPANLPAQLRALIDHPTR